VHEGCQNGAQERSRFVQLQVNMHANGLAKTSTVVNIGAIDNVFMYLSIIHTQN